MKIMEKEELIQSARKLYNNPWSNDTLKKALEESFPELKESEDERIRKNILALVKKHVVNHERCQMEAYLEKQKEQNKWPHVEPISEEENLYLMPQEQKPAERLEAERDGWYVCVKDYYRGGKKQCSVGELVQAKGGMYMMGEEDISEWFRKAYYEEVRDTFEPNTDTTVPEKPVELSEEDEKRIKQLIYDTEHIRAEYEKRKKELGESFNDELIKDCDEQIAWFKSLPERFNLQSNQEWNEDYRQEDLRTRFAFYTYKDEDDVLYLSNVFVEETSRNKGFGTKILAAAEKVAETIGAITIRLKVKQNSPANAWYRKHGYDYMAFEDGYDWLEKTLEYLKPSEQEWSEEDERIMHNILIATEYCYSVERKEIIKKWIEAHIFPQPKHEWSEEDERMRKAVLDEIEHQIEIMPDADDMDSDDQDRYNELISMSVWMEDLPKCMKPYWKPSEEQMNALKVSSEYESCMKNREHLKSLYDHLKK